MSFNPNPNNLTYKKLKLSFGKYKGQYLSSTDINYQNWFVSTFPSALTAEEVNQIKTEW